MPGYSTDNYTRLGHRVHQRLASRPGRSPGTCGSVTAAFTPPYAPAERHLHDYPGATVASPADIYPPRAGKPTYMQKIAAWEKGPSGEPVLSDKAIGSEVGDDLDRDRGRSLSEWLCQYHQAVRALDEGIGQVLAVLRSRDNWRNT